MDDEQKREALKEAYSSEEWKMKVRNMSKAQVTAVYLRLKSKGIV